MVARPLPEFLRTRRGVALLLGFVALVAVVQYLPTLGYGFVWDDSQLIAGNRLLAGSGPLEVFGRGFWAGSPEPARGSAAAYYRPLTNLSFWLDLHVAGGAAWLFHLVNVVLNAAAAVLVTLLIWELLRSGIWAALGGLLFACHPSHVESVAFISGRTDLLVAVFTTAAGFALLRSLRKRDPRWWTVVLAGYALALLSKETALLFPLLVAVAPLLTRTRYSTRYWLLLAAAVLIAGLYLLARAVVLPSALGAPVERLALHQLINVANSFGLYVRMFLWPFAHRAKFPLDPSFHHLSPHTIYTLVFLVMIPLAALRRRFWVSLWGYTWAVCFLLPVSNIVPIGPQAAERLLYLPSAGLVLAAVTLLSRALASRPWLRRVTGVALLALVAAFAADSLLRSRVWRSSRALFGAMVREAPQAPSAYAGLADALSSALPDSAVRLYNRALYFDQGYVPANINLGILYSRLGDHRRAVHQLRLADVLRPDSPAVQYNLGLAWLNAAEPDSALAAFNRAVGLDPTEARPYLGRGLALCFLGRTRDAEADLRLATARDPALAGDLRGFARGLLALDGQQLGSPLGVNRLGSLLAGTGDVALAETCYLRALELDSTWVPALFNQAVILAGRGDTAAALALASRARRLRPDLAPVREFCEALGLR